MSSGEKLHMSLSDRIANAGMRAEQAGKQTNEYTEHTKSDSEVENAKEYVRTEINETSQRKKSRSMGRTHQIHTRLSDRELAQFERRVSKAGLPQGEYIRRAVLYNEIIIEEHSAVDIAILDALNVIQAEIGRQGGMLKMLIRPNEGQRELAPEEWHMLIAAIKDLESAKDMVAGIKHRFDNGNH